MSKPRLLDLFCGAGGAAMGYHRAGFDVVGVDISPQPTYPFHFIQADVLVYMKWSDPVAAGYSAIHASPPCQLWAQGHNPNRESYPDLIEPAREYLVASGLPWVIENVPRAPLVDPVMICGGGLDCVYGDFQLHRHRMFESNFTIDPVPCKKKVRPWTATITGTGTPSGLFYKLGRGLTLEEKRGVMGMPWADVNGLREAIPPAYSEWIGNQLMEHLSKRRRSSG